MATLTVWSLHLSRRPAGPGAAGELLADVTRRQRQRVAGAGRNAAEHARNRSALRDVQAAGLAEAGLRQLVADGIDLEVGGTASAMLSEPGALWAVFTRPPAGSATAAGGVWQPLARAAASASPTIPEVPSHQQREDMLVPVFEQIIFSELRAGDGEGLSHAAGCVAVRGRDRNVEGPRLPAGEGRCGAGCCR